MDDTLLGDDAALVRLLCAVDAAPGLRLALNSSRPCASVRSTLAALAVEVVPVALIGAMGTEIEVDGRPLASWRARFDGFRREPLDAIASERGHPLHDAEYQTPLKASYQVPREDWPRLREALDATGLDLLVTCSGTSDVDIVPAGAGKGAATLFLARHLGVPPERLIAAGDSGNDLPLFAVAGRGIVVGNAREELAGAVGEDRVYRARASHAAGILEGLDHWGLAPADPAGSPGGPSTTSSGGGNPP